MAEKTAYEKSKNSIKKYYAKCKRVEFLLNPENPEDKAIIEFLDAMGGERSRAKTTKAIIKKYMAMTAALKGIN